jgi:hypothetical protein
MNSGSLEMKSKRREAVRERARSIREPIIQRFDTQKPRPGKQCAYLPTFSSSVTLEGLSEPLDDPDIEVPNLHIDHNHGRKRNGDDIRRCQSL